MVDYSHTEKIKVENIDHPLMLLGVRLSYLLVILGSFLLPMIFFGIKLSAVILPFSYWFFKNLSKSEERGNPFYFNARFLSWMQRIYRVLPLANLRALGAIKSAQRIYRA